MSTTRCRSARCGRPSPAFATIATTRASPIRSICRHRQARASATRACARGSSGSRRVVQSYYASYGTSFNPSLETLTLVNGQQSLDPETSRQYELGAKWDLLDGDLSVTSALFEIDKYHTRTQISAGVYELTGNVRVRGFQASVAGRIARGWQVFGGYTFLDAEIVEASALDGTQGKVPANTPRNSASLWTSYDLTREWQVGTGLTYMSDRYTSNNNAVKVPYYLRWDAMIA